MDCQMARNLARPLSSKGSYQQIKIQLAANNTVPQVSVLGPEIFHIFTSNVDESMEYTLYKFVDRTKIGRVIDIKTVGSFIQSNIVHIEDLANITNFSKEDRLFPPG